MEMIAEDIVVSSWRRSDHGRVELDIVVEHMGRRLLRQGKREIVSLPISK